MELWELVRLVSERYGRRLEEHKEARAKSTGLDQITVQQFQYLQAIGRSATPTISSLSSYFGVRSPTATVIVNRLESAGFIKKKADPSDRRSSQLVLTPKAHKLLEAQESAFKALAEDISSALSPSQLQIYTRLTEQVCTALE